MFSELGKIANKQMETSPYQKGELQERHLQETTEVTGNAEKVIEKSDVFEITQREIQEGTKALQPNMEIIKTQSLESVKQSNVEKTQNTVKEENELRELSKEEKQYLRENTSLSEMAIESIKVDVKGKYYLKCRNEELAGKNHEITGVKYVEKTIIVDNVEIVVVVPEFAAIFECEISAEMWKCGDREIFRNCTEQLKDYLESHSEMKSQFNQQELEQIMNGEPYIKGYTWHHSEIPGKIQLVKTKTHAMSGHTGGNSIWCGGIR